MKQFVLLSMLFLIISCTSKSGIEKEIDQQKVTFTLDRFENKFYASNASNLDNLKIEYPYFFPNFVEDSVLIGKIKNPVYRELYDSVAHKYANDDYIKEEVTSLLKHIKYYFPEEKLPAKVITTMNDVDVGLKSFYSDSLVVIGLDCYLGGKSKFYVDFPVYQSKNFAKSQILPDLVSSFSSAKVARANDRQLISAMVYYGKKLYLKDILLPEYTDAEKIGYTELENQWCFENEYYIWSYFIEKKLLFDSDTKNEFKFIMDAPFTKFDLVEIDNESPGRVGQWVGWQIVKSFVKNNPSISLENLLALDANTIFEKSKYKPNK